MLTPALVTHIDTRELSRQEVFTEILSAGNLTARPLRIFVFGPDKDFVVSALQADVDFDHHKDYADYAMLQVDT